MRFSEFNQGIPSPTQGNRFSIFPFGGGTDQAGQCDGDPAGIAAAVFAARLMFKARVRITARLSGPLSFRALAVAVDNRFDCRPMACASRWRSPNAPDCATQHPRMSVQHLAINHGEQVGESVAARDSVHGFMKRHGNGSLPFPHLCLSTHLSSPETKQGRAMAVISRGCGA